MLMPAIRAMCFGSALPLLVTRVLTDHEHGAVAADHLALLTHGFDRSSDLHRCLPYGGEPAQDPGVGPAPAKHDSTLAQEHPAGVMNRSPSRLRRRSERRPQGARGSVCAVRRP